MRLRRPEPWRSPLRQWGVPVEFDVSWIVAAGLLLLTLARGSIPEMYPGLGGRPATAIAVLIVVGWTVSGLLHVLVHGGVARLCGVPVRRVRLFLLGGLVEFEEPPGSPWADLAVALAGPAFSFVLGALLAFASGVVTLLSGPDLLGAPLAYLAAMNVVLAAFSLIPILPLDGGRALRAILWLGFGRYDPAARLAAVLGQILAAVAVLAGVAVALAVDLASGVLVLCFALLLLAEADAARRATQDGRSEATAPAAAPAPSRRTTPPGQGSHA